MFLDGKEKQDIYPEYSYMHLTFTLPVYLCGKMFLFLTAVAAVNILTF